MYAIRSYYEAIADKVQGRTEGLKPSQLKALSRLYGRRFPAEGGMTSEQARELAVLSFGLSRQIGLLIDRQGRVQMVVVGDASSILIPELGRVRASGGRLRGLRLLHTHLGPDGLSQEDLMDMVFLRLDAVQVLTIAQDGMPARTQHAHLLPKGGEKPYLVSELVRWDRDDTDFAAQAQALEDELARGEDARAVGKEGRRNNFV